MIYVDKNKYIITGTRKTELFSRTYNIPKKNLIGIKIQEEYNSQDIKFIRFTYEFRYNHKVETIEYVLYASTKGRVNDLMEYLRTIKKAYYELNIQIDVDNYSGLILLIIHDSNKICSLLNEADKKEFKSHIKILSDKMPGYTKMVLYSTGNYYYNKIISERDNLIKEYKCAEKIIFKTPEAKKIWIKEKSTINDKRIDDLLLKLSLYYGGCYIATCVYGSYDCPEVWTLRRFRDNTLAETWYGRVFIRVYYSISPKIVELFGNTIWFKKFWKERLDNMVKKLHESGVKDTPYEDKKW